MKQDDAIQILDEKQIGPDAYTLKVRESIPAVNKLEGYIPHFFHDKPQKIPLVLKVGIEASAGNLRIPDDPVDGYLIDGRPGKFLKRRVTDEPPFLFRKPVKPV